MKDIINETANLILDEKDQLFEMTNLTGRRTGLAVTIWSEQKGESRNKSDNNPRFKITGKGYSLSVSLEKNPKILAQSGKIKQSDKKDIDDAIEYVKRNLDLFLKHYKSSELVFDDDDLKQALRDRGEYK